MAAHDVIILNETVPQLQEPQAGDTYRMPADVEITGNLTISGTVDGIDVAASAAVAATATQPGDNFSTLVNDILASQAEAETGTNNTKMMTPLRVAQAIAILAAGIQNNYNASTDPLATDDDSEGYSAGSYWINAVSEEVFRCIDPSTNIAVWVKTTLTTDELATVALSADSDDLIEGTVNLLLTVAERAKLAALTTDVFTTSIIAWPTGGQASAVQLAEGVSVITTVGSDGDSVKLPTAAANKRCVVMNQGANHVDLFPASGDQIADNSVDAAIVLGSHYSIQLIAIDDTTWIQL